MAADSAAPVAAAAVPVDRRLTGDHTITEWAHDLLTAMNVPVTQVNMAALITWANHESGGYNPAVAGGLNNPLNTTEGAYCAVGVKWPAPGSCRNGGSQGDIKDFSTYDQGIQAQAYNLTHTRGAGYEAIIAALQRGNDAQGVFRAVDASAFGTKNLAGSNPVISGVGGSNAGATGTSATGSTSSDSDCVWKLTMPGPVPNFCLTHAQGRALLGAATMSAGILLLVVAAGIASRRQIAGLAATALK